jgi:hypothetical protein
MVYEQKACAEDLKAGSLDPEELLDWIEDEYRKRRV